MHLAAQLCSDRPALEAAAEECMAAHNPLPYEMVEGVLLSPDLVPPHPGELATKVRYFGVKSAKVYLGTDGHLMWLIC